MSMDDTTILAALRRHWEYEATDKDSSHEIYDDDAVLEFPQSQERYEGKANFLVWRKQYPASLEFKIRRIRGQGNAKCFRGPAKILSDCPAAYFEKTIIGVSGELTLSNSMGISRSQRGGTRRRNA